MSKTWSSKNENIYDVSFKQTSKLEPRKVYQISDVKTIKTKYGDKNILIDDGLNEYWTTKQVDRFIKQNKDVKKFTLITLAEKELETNDKKIIKYFDVEISYD